MPGVCLSQHFCKEADLPRGVMAWAAVWPVLQGVMLVWMRPWRPARPGAGDACPRVAFWGWPDGTDDGEGTVCVAVVV